jgi:hypothetical protein
LIEALTRSQRAANNRPTIKPPQSAPANTAHARDL